MFSQKCASQLNVTICIYLLELKKKKKKDCFHARKVFEDWIANTRNDNGKKYCRQLRLLNITKFLKIVIILKFIQ